MAEEVSEVWLEKSIGLYCHVGFSVIYLTSKILGHQVEVFKISPNRVYSLKRNPWKHYDWSLKKSFEANLS